MRSDQWPIGTRVVLVRPWTIEGHTSAEPGGSYTFMGVTQAQIGDLGTITASDDLRGCVAVRLDRAELDGRIDRSCLDKLEIPDLNDQDALERWLSS